MNHIRIAIAVPTIGFVLACGGIANEAKTQSWCEMTIMLESAADSPEKKAVGDLIDEGWLHADELGIMETSDFRKEVEAAVADGAIDPAELQRLQGMARKFTPPATSSPERDQRLLAKRTQEQEVKADKARKAAKDFESWDAAATARRIQHAGWQPEDCDVYADEYVSAVSCEARKDKLVAMIDVDTYRDLDEARDMGDGYDALSVSERNWKTVLTVSVVDGMASGGVLQALVPAGTDLRTKDHKWLEAGMEAQGWTASECDSYREGSYHSYDCDLRKGDLGGMAMLTVDPSMDWGDGELRVSGGSAIIDQKGASIDVAVYDRAKAEALLKGLTSVAPASP